MNVNCFPCDTKKKPSNFFLSPWPCCMSIGVFILLWNVFNFFPRQMGYFRSGSQFYRERTLLKV